jgi:hypothetical protein
MFLMPVKFGIVRHGNRLEVKRGIVFDGDDSWRSVDQLFQKSIIVAVHIN